MKSKAVASVTIGILVGFFSSAAAEPQSVGVVAAVKNQVNVTHLGIKKGVLVEKGDAVFFQDVYETGPGARAKLLFADDSIVTLSESAKLAITENIYDPAKDQRSTVVNLVSGKARTLVGKAFSGSGSKFEVHTPTAVAAARGTYFVVWVFEQNGQVATGVWSSEGKVDVSNINGTVLGSVQVADNQFTIIGADVPPVQAAVPNSALVESLLSGTDLENQASEEEIPSLLTEPDETDLPDIEEAQAPPDGQPSGDEAAAKQKADAGEEGAAPPSEEGPAEPADPPATPPTDQAPETPTTDIELKFTFP